MITIQKLSFMISCVALVFSVIAFMVANKANYGSMEYELNRSFQPIGNVPDVEIIKADGSVEKLNALASQDQLNGLINTEKTNKQTRQNNTGIGINNDAVKQKNKIEPAGNIATNNKSVTNKVISNMELQKVESKQPDKINTTTVKNTVMKTRNIAVPVVRQNGSQIKATNTLADNKIKNVDNSETPKSNISNKKKTQQSSLIKGVVVQVGSFKERTSAEQQCKKINGQLEGKECKVGTFGNLFGSLIVPFKDVDEARAFDKTVLNKQGIYGYIKNINQ